jgi:nicotinamide phosphoribosyltransferase
MNTITLPSVPQLGPTALNPLLALDVYKMGHMEQYVPRTTRVYSYLMARSDKTFSRVVFMGLQYYLAQYLKTRLTPAMGEEFLAYRQRILGVPNPPDVVAKIRALARLGYWPLRIKALPEGTVIGTRQVLMTIENTHPDFYWCVGFIESLLLKVWYPTTVASHSYRYRQVVNAAFDATVGPEQDFLRPFMVHDFGYRGDSSEEGAALSGIAHLLSFTGSDTVPALPLADRYYGGREAGLVMASVPASEHSVMCSYGVEDELAAFRRMLELYPTGLVSIVSDTYDIYRVLTEFTRALAPAILARPLGSKVVFRPDSGNPEYIIAGDPTAPADSPEGKGAIRLLDEVFGHTVNSKGYKVLHPNVGLIYGDGMYLERYERTLARLQSQGYAASNFVIGVGGILRHHSRDTLGFALKATYVEVDGVPREIEKTPATDPRKRSHKGLITLARDEAGEYVTHDRQTAAGEAATLLALVFEDGQLTAPTTLTEMRARVAATL